jgi:microcystin-dependent protein
MIDWPAPTAPNLWHIADGTSLLAAAYPDLFAVIGYSYGGAGASFNLPDTRSRAVVAAGAGPGLTARSMGAKGGLETVALTATQNGPHTHGMTNLTTAANSGLHTHPGTTAAGSGSHTHTATTTAGSGQHTHPGTTGGANARHTHSTAAFVVGAPSGANTYVWSGGFGNTGNDAPDHGHAFTAASETNHQHVLTSDGDNPVHQHTFTSGNETNHQHTLSGSTDAGGSTGAAHENMPPFVALAKIIKILPSTAASLTTLTVIERTR